MDLSTFYAVVSATCFTLVGLWWSAVDRRRELLHSPTTRRLVGGVYLTFLLPGVMGLFAQVDPGRSGVWRTTFGAAAVVGAWSTIRLVREDRGPGARGPFRRHRWLVAVLFLVVLAFGVSPELADGLGLSGLQGAAIAISCLVVLAHGLAWELLTTDDEHGAGAGAGGPSPGAASADG
ncbi:hypothetical protein [Intrasporangium sp. YIM S08009]|uniref:hypothetical protein n=1 Tax=Intrasporangium zincisolvens TaxID=3080018 RepID=UPI002B06269F|nr:hypothetical protein [Intrasporangium sp. YIM S08009]